MRYTFGVTVVASIPPGFGSEGISSVLRERHVPIGKQEFYEGAALYSLARSGRITSMRYEPPFFVVNERLLILLKYSTKVRSPWGFTFTRDEQVLLDNRANGFKTIIGLICGADGVAALPYEAYRLAANAKPSSVHIACYRRHREHYEVSGPDGSLADRVAPSDWRRILDDSEESDATS